LNFEDKDVTYSFNQIEFGIAGPRYRYIKNILIEYISKENSISIFFLENEKEFVFNFFSVILENIENWDYIYLNKKLINIKLKKIKKKEYINTENKSYISTIFYPYEEIIKNLKSQLYTHIVLEENTLELVLNEAMYAYFSTIMIIYGTTEEEKYINQEKELNLWNNID